MTSAISTYSLVILRGGIRGQVFKLKNGINLIGRWDPESGSFPEIDLENEDPEAKISRKHAQVEVAEQSVSIQDLGSLNGTYVNRGQRLQSGVRCRLQVGDEIICGKTFLKLIAE